MTDPVIKSPSAVVGTVRIGAVRATARRDASPPPAAQALPVQPRVPQRTLQPLQPGGPEAPPPALPAGLALPPASSWARPPASPAPAAPPPHFSQGASGLQQADPELEQQRMSAHAAGHAAGYEAGLAEGLTEGRATARREHAARDREMRDALAATLAGMQDAQRRFQQDLEQTGLDIAFAAVVQVFGRLPGHESVVRHAVRQAMEQAGALADARLHLHPQDAESIAPLMQELAADRRASWTVCADAGITRGGCRISSAQGEIDATIESQLRNLAALLQRHRDAGPAAAVASPPDAAGTGAVA
jgi:flagellar assembly protein FliH